MLRSCRFLDPTVSVGVTVQDLGSRDWGIKNQSPEKIRPTPPGFRGSRTCSPP